VPPWKDDYAWYEGGGWAWGQTDYAANSLTTPNRPKCLKILDIRDGTSNTVTVGEKAMLPANYVSGTWFWDDPFFLGGPGSLARWGNKVIRDDAVTGLAFRENWGSPHAGGAQFVFADGSVRTIQHDTNPDIVLILRTPDGNEPVPDF
jgi:prepilin-type processing-associated H-X9-DG protein